MQTRLAWSAAPRSFVKTRHPDHREAERLSGQDAPAVPSLDDTDLAGVHPDDQRQLLLDRARINLRFARRTEAARLAQEERDRIRSHGVEQLLTAFREHARSLSQPATGASSMPRNLIQFRGSVVFGQSGLDMPTHVAGNEVGAALQLADTEPDSARKAESKGTGTSIGAKRVGSRPVSQVSVTDGNLFVFQWVGPPRIDSPELARHVL